MKAIFLSASIPNREPFVHYFDAIAIREAVLALVSLCVRKTDLVFGGHPAISPLVEHAVHLSILVFCGFHPSSGEEISQSEVDSEGSGPAEQPHHHAPGDDWISGLRCRGVYRRHGRHL
jgi:hypothetical protein